MSAKIPAGADPDHENASRRIVAPEILARREAARLRSRQRVNAKRDMAARNAAERAAHKKQARLLVDSAIELGLREQDRPFVQWLLEQGATRWLGDVEQSAKLPTGVPPSVESEVRQHVLQGLIRRSDLSAQRVRLARQILAGRDPLGLVSDAAFSSALDDFLICQPRKRRGPRPRSALRAASGVFDVALAQGGLPPGVERRHLAYRMARLSSGEGVNRGRGGAAEYVANQTKRRSDTLTHARRLRRAQVMFGADMDGLLDVVLAMADAGDQHASKMIADLGQRIEDAAAQKEKGISRRNALRIVSGRGAAR